MTAQPGTHDFKLTAFIKKYFGRYIDLYLPGEKEALIEKAEPIFCRMMNEAPYLGGSKNMMASNLDITVAFFAFYEASDHRIGGDAISMMVNWLAEDYKWVTPLLDMNKHSYVRPLYYRIYSKHAKEVEAHKAKGEWGNTWSLRINPDGRKDGIYYHMVGCPLYAFVKSHGYEEMMPYICQFDYVFEKFLHARLIRTQTEALGGDCCDYWFVPDKGEIAEQYKDYQGV